MAPLGVFTIYFNRDSFVMFLNSSVCVCVCVKYSRFLVVATIEILHKNRRIALNLYVAVNSFHLDKPKLYAIL